MNARWIAALVLLLPPACGGNSDPRALTNEGDKARNSGDYEAAAESYEAALAKLDPSSPDWMRAKMGLIQAHAQTDAAKSKDEFLELAANTDKVTDKEFNQIAARLGEAGHLTEAIAILEVGKERFPESLHLDALGKDLVQRAKEAGDEGALDSLKGLGYTGD